MGCDIHVFVEYKLYGGDRWSNFGGEFRLPRNYTLFGYLAGIRGYADPKIPPRGMPKDPSWWVGDFWNEQGEHTPTCMTYDELRNVLDDYVVCEGHGLSYEWDALLQMARVLQNGSRKPVRIVFWFDS